MHHKHHCSLIRSAFKACPEALKGSLYVCVSGHMGSLPCKMVDAAFLVTIQSAVVLGMGANRIMPCKLSAMALQVSQSCKHTLQAYSPGIAYLPCWQAQIKHKMRVHVQHKQCCGQTRPCSSGMP